MKQELETKQVYLWVEETNDGTKLLLMHEQGRPGAYNDLDSLVNFCSKLIGRKKDQYGNKLEYIGHAPIPDYADFIDGRTSYSPAPVLDGCTSCYPFDEARMAEFNEKLNHYEKPNRKLTEDQEFFVRDTLMRIDGLSNPDLVQKILLALIEQFPKQYRLYKNILWEAFTNMTFEEAYEVYDRKRLGEVFVEIGIEQARKNFRDYIDFERKAKDRM
jgi:hypothetical protein